MARTGTVPVDGIGEPEAGSRLRWKAIGTLTLRYRPDDEFVEFDAHGAGQVFGTMEGELEVEGLAGRVVAVNTALRRSDGLFEPALRGVLTTYESAKLYFRLDGLSSPDPAKRPNHRVVLSVVRLQSGIAAFERWNRAFLVHDARGAPFDGTWRISGPLLEAAPE